MATDLASATWPSIGDLAQVLVPVGSIEQHGPHLPMDTDTVIATEVARRVAERLDGHVVVAPALCYGSSGEHQSFAGTASIGGEALRIVIVELVRSLSTWADRIVFVNAHGGNVPVLIGAVSQMRDERHDVTWVPCATEEVDAHAGITETSLMLYLRPDDVRLDLAEPGNTAPIRDLLPMLIKHGVAAVSPNGVLGDPTGASAEHGAEVLEQMVAQIAARVTSW